MSRPLQSAHWKGAVNSGVGGGTRAALEDSLVRVEGVGLQPQKLRRNSGGSVVPQDSNVQLKGIVPRICAGAVPERCFTTSA